MTSFDPPPIQDWTPEPPQSVPDRWYLRMPNGQTFGPVSRQQLDRWLAESRVTAECQVMVENHPWVSAAQVYPHLQPPAVSRSVYCSNCGAMANSNAVVCIKCGAQLARISSANTGRIQPTANTLDPGIAALLSFLLVGLPQMLMGQKIKGVVMIIVALILAALTGCIACLVTYPVGAVDAYMIASKLKRGQSVGEWEFF